MDRLIGVFLVTLSAMLFGANPILARISYDAGADPATFLFMRFLIASPIMIVIMLAGGYAIPRGKLLLSLIMLGGIGAATTFCFYTAIHLAPVNLIIVITYMYPTMVTLLSALFLKQAITSYKIVALIMTIVGISFAIGMDSGGYVLGIILAVLTAVCFSCFLILSSIHITKVRPLPATTIIILSSTAIYGIYIAIQGPQLPVDISGWAAAAASGLFSTSLGQITFFTGLKRIDTANAAIISTFEVIVAVALAMIILGETLSLPKILGACLVLSAVIVLARSEYEIAHTKVSHSVSR